MHKCIQTHKNTHRHLQTFQTQFLVHAYLHTQQLYIPKQAHPGPTNALMCKEVFRYSIYIQKTDTIHVHLVTLTHNATSTDSQM